MRPFLQKPYRLSPDSIVRKMRKLITKRDDVHHHEPFRPVNAEFLSSGEYRTLMSIHLPYDGSYDHHEAQNLTSNFRFRHFEARNRLGVFRWRGIQENLDVLLPLITNPSKMIIDFGGAACPLGFNSKIVDLASEDVTG